MNETLLQRLLMLEQSWQKHRSKVFLHLHRLRDQQHVFVVSQMQFSTRLLVLFSHVVQFPSSSASYREEGANRLLKWSDIQLPSKWLLIAL